MFSIGEVKEKLLAKYAEMDERLELSQLEEKLKSIRKSVRQNELSYGFLIYKYVLISVSKF